MTRALRVLYYNWVDYHDPEQRGGGVSTYQRNLMQAWADDKRCEAVFISSGLSYDLPARAPRWERQRCDGPSARADKTKRYDIVNSGVLAPAHHAFGNDAQIHHAATQQVFFDFIEKTGPYDVVHFNNLEGLPASVLELKKLWPQTRVVLSLHNYYPFCAQVNLWFQEKVSCTDFQAGQNCTNCLPHRHDDRLLRLANGLAYRLKWLGFHPKTWAFDVAFRWTLRFGVRLNRAMSWLRRQGHQPTLINARSAAAGFSGRRAQMVDLINRHCDQVLCVSKAVQRLAVGFGINPDLAQVSYIGTRAAESFHRTKPRGRIVADDATLTLGFLGYMRRDKGFFFLLDALEALPPETLCRLRLVVAARRGDAATMARLMTLGGRLAGLTFRDGYGAQDLDDLLQAVDVGVIPVLWHDNLPQVAIEMHARHIPLLTADRGGAQELGNCPDMVFAAGNIAAFHNRINALLSDQFDPNAYWQGALAPVSMPDHIEALFQDYTRVTIRKDDLQSRAFDVRNSEGARAA